MEYDKDSVTKAIYAQKACFGSAADYALAAGWWIDAAPERELLDDFAKQLVTHRTVKLVGKDSSDASEVRKLSVVCYRVAYPSLSASVS
jgi:hypothetical protein